MNKHFVPPSATLISGPVTLINAFSVPLEESDPFLERWKDSARIMARQPGFIRARMLRSLATEAELRFVNVAEWDSGIALAHAQSRSEWQSAVQHMLDDPDLHITPRPDVYQIALDVHPG